MKKILLPLVAFLFGLSSFAQSTDGITGNSARSFDQKISLYPNPTKDFVVINNVVESGVKEIEVFNVVGKKVKITFTSGLRNSIKLDLSRLNPGIFFVRFYDPSGNMVGTRKVQKVV